MEINPICWISVFNVFVLQMIPTLTWAYLFFKMCGGKKTHQPGFTDPLIQVPGHKIHFTATGSGANVSFEALGGDFGQETPNPKDPDMY